MSSERNTHDCARATLMEPRIQYAKTEDGMEIAYWTLGEA